MKETALSVLSPGQSCQVVRIDHTGGLRRRLLDLGFRPEATLQVLYTAPGGSPMAILCNGAVIGLRREDCRKIKVVIRDA